MVPLRCTQISPLRGDEAFSRYSRSPSGSVSLARTLMVVSVPARALTVSLVGTGAWFDGSVFAGADWPSQNPPVAAPALPGDPVRPSPATRVTAAADAIFLMALDMVLRPPRLNARPSVPGSEWIVSLLGRLVRRVCPATGTRPRATGDAV